MKRREFIISSAALSTATLLKPATVFSKEAKKKPLRVAHLSDMHLKPGKEIEAAVARAMQHAQQISPKVDFIINGGDAIMDALEADKQKTQIQWDLLTAMLKNEISLPVYHCIGNHDVWGWFVKENKPVDERQYGKVWAIETLNLKNRYYSFSKDYWHFIVLDSTQLNPAGGYIGKLDEEQLTWLQTELASVVKEKFICIISHIPILSVCAGLFFNKTEENGDLKIQRNLMHTDFLSLKKIFQKFSNIKVCISGHIHLQDEVNYLGIKYYCNGAVSGNWWNGSFQEFAPAYALLEFHDDGRCNRTMINY
ncbi:MAG TPA: metallophosphoesterase [Chitinophagaceae bacterium]|nr:metallophosphoesterase [Chitinophagaceae bacterium]